jgi:hypothetical protein
LQHTSTAADNPWDRLEREKQENARIRKKEKASEENFQNSIVQLGKF